MLGITITKKAKIQEMEKSLNDFSKKVAMLERHNLKLRLSNQAVSDEKISLQDDFFKIRGELESMQLELQSIVKRYIRPRDAKGRFAKSES